MKRNWTGAAATFLLFTTIGLLFFAYKYLDFVARAQSTSIRAPLIEELTGAYVAALLFPLIVRFCRRYPPDRTHWARFLLLQAGGMTFFSMAKTIGQAVSRKLLFPLFGLGAYDYGSMPARFAMEYAKDVIVYASMAAIIYLWDHYRANRDRELRAAQLESKLAQAQLQNLRLQLQPHFLFNALNTSSSLMYEDPRAADARKALVPQLILQPLVENSIRHGADPVSSKVDISVRVRRDNGSLTLAVRDGGRGIDGQVAKGIGLSNTAERLGQLYGDRQRLQFENAADGGLLVTLQLPYHTQ